MDHANATTLPTIPTSHAVEHTTLIVGAGICGLATAYHLAKRQTKDERERRIIVIDIRKHVFGASSGLNSGIVAYQWLTGDLREIAEYSFNIYKHLSKEDPKFQRTCGFHDHSILKLKTGISPSCARIPAWLDIPEGWHVEEVPGEGQAAALDPNKLGQWLATECSTRKVEIYNLSRLVNVDLSSDGVIEYAHIRRSGTTIKLRCQDLILATGPWTPMLFKTLFPKSNRQFEPSTSSSNWTVVDDPTASGSDSMAQVFFNDGAGNNVEFVSRGDGKIWLSGLNDMSTPITDVEDDASPDSDAISKLQGLSRRFIADSKSASSIGRTYRPTISRKTPIIASVPLDKLCGDSIHTTSATVAGKPNTGVYLLFGHDRHGLLHGMGSGALMSQLVQGLPIDLNMDKFGIPD